MVKAQIKKRPKESDWLWVQPTRDRWLTSVIPDGENEAARVSESSRDSKGNRIYFCYRNGRYLGSEKTLEDAKERCWIGQRTPESEAFIQFQYEHPGKIPPGLPFTEADYYEWKRRHPGGPGTETQGQKLQDNEKKMALKAERVKEKVKDIPTDGTIRLLKSENPKTVGTGAWKRWDFLFKYDGKSVAAYLGAKGNPDTLQNAIRQGYVEVKA